MPEQQETPQQTDSAEDSYPRSEYEIYEPSTDSIYNIITFILTLLIASAAAALSHTNPYIPPGSEGYIFERPRMFGSGGFRGTVIGPNNYGLSLFRNEAIIIDVRPKTYTEEFNILAKDDLNINFKFHAVISVISGNIEQVVNKFGGEQWYSRYAQEPFRTFVRDEVQRYQSAEVKSVMTKVAEQVQLKLETYLEGKPFHLVSLVVGKINYPKLVADAVERKLAAQQLLQEKTVQKLIAIRNAEIAVEEAKGSAEAQRIISASLTDKYLQYDAINAQRVMATSPNHTTVYIPVGNNGLPIVHQPVKKQ